MPLFDFPLWDLFRLLGVEGTLNVFMCVLLEHQILFYSSGEYDVVLNMKRLIKKIPSSHTCIFLKHISILCCILPVKSFSAFGYVTLFSNFGIYMIMICILKKIKVKSNQNHLYYVLCVLRL